MFVRLFVIYGFYSSAVVFAFAFIVVVIIIIIIIILLSPRLARLFINSNILYFSPNTYLEFLFFRVKPFWLKEYILSYLSYLIISGRICRGFEMNVHDLRVIIRFFYNALSKAKECRKVLAFLLPQGQLWRLDKSIWTARNNGAQIWFKR